MPSLAWFSRQRSVNVQVPACRRAGAQQDACLPAHRREPEPDALTPPDRTTGANKMTIEGKTVLVTGANRGIGQALAAEALARGAKRGYAGTRQPLTHPDARVTPLILDVTSTAQVQAAASQAGSLDILINNAGVALPDLLTDPAALEPHLAV